MRETGSTFKSNFPSATPPPILPDKIGAPSNINSTVSSRAALVSNWSKYPGSWRLHPNDSRSVESSGDQNRSGGKSGPPEKSICEQLITLEGDQRRRPAQHYTDPGQTCQSSRRDRSPPIAISRIRISSIFPETTHSVSDGNINVAESPSTAGQKKSEPPVRQLALDSPESSSAASAATQTFQTLTYAVRRSRCRSG